MAGGKHEVHRIHQRPSLQCRRILRGRKLLGYVRTVVTVIFDVMTEEV